MKHVPRLAAEPSSLAAYRAAHSADDAASGDEAGGAWARFRNEASAYAQLRDALLAAQGGLCAYCEQRVTAADGTLIPNDHHIEHLLSKAAGVGRTLDWTNMFLCCGGGTYREWDRGYRDAVRHYTSAADVSCGHAKGEHVLPPSCDPRLFPCIPRLVDIGLDGAIAPNATACASAGIPPSDLATAIDALLNLNCERLKRARLKTVDNLLHWIVPVLEETLQASSHSTAAETADFRELFIAGRLQPDAHGHLRAFWTTERQYLEPDSTAWIAKKGALLGCLPPPASPGTP
jgi:uncharacterized protein (TIGR02646 family)